MSTPAIKSQPVYAELEWDRAGTHHILFVAAEDAALAQRLLSNPPAGTITLIHLGSASAEARSCWSQGLPDSALYLETHSLAEALGSRPREVAFERLGLVDPGAKPAQLAGDAFFRSPSRETT